MSAYINNVAAWRTAAAARNTETRILAYYSLEDHIMMSVEMKEAHKRTAQAASMFDTCTLCASSPPGNLLVLCEGGHLGCGKCCTTLGRDASDWYKGRRGRCAHGHCAHAHLPVPVPIAGIDHLIKSTMGAAEALTHALRTDHTRNAAAVQEATDAPVDDGDLEGFDMEAMVNTLMEESVAVEEPPPEKPAAVEAVEEPADEDADGEPLFIAATAFADVLHQPAVDANEQGVADRVAAGADEEEATEEPAGPASDDEEPVAPPPVAKPTRKRKAALPAVEMTEEEREAAAKKKKAAAANYKEKRVANKRKIEDYDAMSAYMVSLGGSEEGFRAFKFARA